MLVSKQFIAQSEADKSNALVNTTQEALKAAQRPIILASPWVARDPALIALAGVNTAVYHFTIDRPHH